MRPSYLKGVSTGDSSEALQAPAGKDDSGFSPNVIVRLKEKWGQEYEEWSRRDLTGQEEVYIWADGIWPAFYDFPAEHWGHVRTTNPIESTFSTIRLRHRRTKGIGSRKASLTMMFKLAQSASRRWRRPCSRRKSVHRRSPAECLLIQIP